MTFPTYGVTATGFGSASTTHNVDIPALDDGDGLIVIFQASGGGGITEPASYASGILYETSNAIICCRKASGSSSATTENFATANAVTAVATVIKIDAGTWSEDISEIEINTQVTGSGTAPDPGSITASWGGDDNLFIAELRAIDDDVHATAAPTNYSDLSSAVSGGGTNNGNTSAVAFRQLAAASDNPGAFTLASSENWGAHTLVVRGAAAGGGGSEGAALHHYLQQMGAR